MSIPPLSKPLAIFTGEVIETLLGQIQEASEGRKIFAFPECRLSLLGQIEVARQIVTLVNAGQNVALITHSDMIVRELNSSVIAFNSTEDESDEWLIGLGYPREKRLNQEHVEVFDLQNSQLCALECQKNGFESPSMDDAIVSQNSTQEKLYVGH